MPRDLHDLMEGAVSSAPPETHLAGDITRAAERAQRRRTTWVAAGAAAAVVAVAGVTVGLTQHHPSMPEPSHRPYRYDQSVDASNAVPASSLPGYRLEPWTIPSLQQLKGQDKPVQTYTDVDQQGRLLVGTFADDDGTKLRTFKLYDAPGESPRPLRTPPSPGVNGSSVISWVPSFFGTDQLIWTPSSPIFSVGAKGPNGYHLTDLNGEHDTFVATRAEL